MFKNYYGETVHAELNQTLIHGTLRMQDLIPVWLETLKETVHYQDLLDLFPKGALEDENHPYWDTLECHNDFDFLWMMMGNNAPVGYYFGNTEGNSSDFGFWKHEEEEE